MSAGVEDRLRAVEAVAARISDERAIERLIDAYGPTIDHGEPDAYADLFTDGGIVEIRSALSASPDGSPFPEAMVGFLASRGGERTDQGMMFRGRDALVRFVTREARTARSLHVCTQARVTLTGSDAAEATSYLRIYSQAPGEAPALTHFGRYLDRFERTLAGWRISHRICEL